MIQAFFPIKLPAKRNFAGDGEAVAAQMSI